MNNVTVTRTVRVNLTAGQWALYDIPGRDSAAAKLNRASEAALNSCGTRGEAEALIALALDEQSYFGASDTEGYDVMYDLLDVAFPR